MRYKIAIKKYKVAITRNSHPEQLGETKLHCIIRSQLQEKVHLLEKVTTTRKKLPCESHIVRQRHKVAFHDNVTL